MLWKSKLWPAPPATPLKSMRFTYFAANYPVNMKQYLSTKYNENAWHFGLLILRLAFGGFMIYFGYNKLIHFASPQNGVKGMSIIFGSPIDGILLVFAEFFCAILLVIGMFTRFALIPLIIAMSVAFFKVNKGVIFNDSGAHPALMFLCVYLALLFTGPGKYSVDRVIAK
jgi:putative oxidoreductase